MTTNKSLFLIDTNAFCYRAFYAFSGLVTSSGQPTNAVYGFINILNKILKTHKPDYLICCFDVSRETFRTKKFSEYKMQRPPMPEGLVSQIALIKEVISAYHIPIFEKGFEADDIIAELARKAASSLMQVTIVSFDKDILQLVDKRITVFNPYKDSGVFYDLSLVKERFGVAPKMVADIIALMGDDADNIPGVPGIGEKTAIRLISDFGSLNKLLKNISKVTPDKIKEAISENIERIKLNKELINLDESVDMQLDLKSALVRDPDYTELSRIFKKLEFKSLLKDLPLEEGKTEKAKLHYCHAHELKSLLKSAHELFLYGTSIGKLSFAIDNKLFNAQSGRDCDLCAAISDGKIKKTGHDLKKLKVSLFRDGIIFNGLDFDIMIAAYLLNPSRLSYALTDLALENLGEFIREENLEKEDGLALVIKLKPVLVKALKEKDLFQLFTELEMPLTSVLAAMEQDGIKLDLDLLKNLSRDLEKRLIKLIADIYEASGTQFNINSPKQLGQVLFEKLRLPVIKKTKTGFSTDEEVLKRLADKHPLPVFLLEYRQLTKLKNTYVDALPKLVNAQTGRVHTSFNQAQTETGRLSSSNPNLQNIPIKTDIGAKIRQAIIASGKDNCLLSCDYSQIELRVLAHLSGDDTLLKAFHTNQDVHRLTASLIHGISEFEVKDNMREVAKRVNFGIIYGQSAYGLSKDLEIPVFQAQNFIDAYFLRYPKVRSYIDAQIKKAKDIGFVTTLLGRRRYIPEINNKNISIRQFAERQAVNTPIQGTASDLIKLAMIKIFKQINVLELKSKMILQIHDELVFDLPVLELKVLTKLVKDEMENVMQLDVPIKVDMKMGQNWLDMLACPAGREIIK